MRLILSLAILCLLTPVSFADSNAVAKFKPNVANKEQVKDLAKDAKKKSIRSPDSVRKVKMKDIKMKDVKIKEPKIKEPKIKDPEVKMPKMKF